MVLLIRRRLVTDSDWPRLVRISPEHFELKRNFCYSKLRIVLFAVMLCYFLLCYIGYQKNYAQNRAGFEENIQESAPVCMGRLCSIIRKQKGLTDNGYPDLILFLIEIGKEISEMSEVLKKDCCT